MNKPEQWKYVVGVDSYEISDAGRVRRARPARASKVGRILRLGVDERGYPRLSLWNGGKRRTYKVHALVAEAFIGPRPPGMQVNHISGIKSDNSVANLEYVTPIENVRHADRNGLRSGLFGERNHKAKLTEEQVREIRALRGTLSGPKIAERYGVAPATVFYVLSGRTWKDVR